MKDNIGTQTCMKLLELLMLISQAACLISFASFKVSAENPVNIHDIAITAISPSKSIVRQGFCWYNFTIITTLKNQGNFTETFKIFTFCGYHETITLPAYKSITINYTVNTSKLPLGKCRTWAYVPPCFGDNNPLNNLFAGENFTVTFLADINEDCKVDILDIFSVARAYGSYPEHPRWDPRGDLDCNGKINIMDIFKVARDFGKRIEDP